MLRLAFDRVSRMDKVNPIKYPLEEAASQARLKPFNELTEADMASIPIQEEIEVRELPNHDLVYVPARLNILLVEGWINFRGECFEVGLDGGKRFRRHTTVFDR